MTDMFIPDCIKSEVEALRNMIKLEKDEFVQNERRWINNNLSVLYGKYNVLDVELNVNPYIRIVDYTVQEQILLYLIIPKFWALQEMVFYHWKLDGVDAFMNSLYHYGSKIKGQDIIEFSCDYGSCANKERLSERMNIVFRKFLSYQYLIVE